MNPIHIIVGGIISSIFLIFLCIFTNVEEYYTELGMNEEKIVFIKKPTIVLKDRRAIKIETKKIIIKPIELKNSIESLQEKISSLLKTTPITFKKNSGRISDNGKEVLNELFILLENREKLRIYIQTHTDAGGKRKINSMISQIRANKIKRYLIQKGLSANILFSKGLGESQLLLTDRPYSKLNRRVEIYIKRK